MLKSFSVFLKLCTNPTPQKGDSFFVLTVSGVSVVSFSHLAVFYPRYGDKYNKRDIPKISSPQPSIVV